MFPSHKIPSPLPAPAKFYGYDSLLVQCLCFLKIVIMRKGLSGLFFYFIFLIFFSYSSLLSQRMTWIFQQSFIIPQRKASWWDHQWNKWRNILTSWYLYGQTNWVWGCLKTLTIGTLVCIIGRLEGNSIIQALRAQLMEAKEDKPAGTGLP